MAETTAPYRPSNGDEGAYFRRDFCDRCKRDTEQQCQIYAKAFLHDVDEPGYPPEWIADADGFTNPRCTAFEDSNHAV